MNCNFNDRKTIKLKDFRAYFDECLDTFEHFEKCFDTFKLDDTIIFTALLVIGKEIKKLKEKSELAWKDEDYNAYRRHDYNALLLEKNQFDLLLHWNKPYFVGRIQNGDINSYALVHQFTISGKFYRHYKKVSSPLCTTLKRNYGKHDVTAFTDITESGYTGWLPTRKQVNRLIELCRNHVQMWVIQNETTLPTYHYFNF